MGSRGCIPGIFSHSEGCLFTLLIVSFVGLVHWADPEPVTGKDRASCQSGGAPALRPGENGLEWVNLTQMTVISTTVGRNPLEEMVSQRLQELISLPVCSTNHTGAPRLPDWASLELSLSVESCGCGLGPSPVRLGHILYLENR